MKTIYNTYVVMESQEQCDRMKSLCVDNNLKTDRDMCFEKYDVFRYSKVFREFGNWNEDDMFDETTEKEFIELLKTTKC